VQHLIVEVLSGKPKLDLVFLFILRREDHLVFKSVLAFITVRRFIFVILTVALCFLALGAILK